VISPVTPISQLSVILSVAFPCTVPHTKYPVHRTRFFRL